MKAYECQLLAVKSVYSCCNCQVGVMYQLSKLLTKCLVATLSVLEDPSSPH